MINSRCESDSPHGLVGVYAHTIDGFTDEHWEPLPQHLHEVSELAGEFASRFGARELGLVAGLWHDLGKYAPEFQAYLRASHAGAPSVRVDHATAGALHAARAGAPKPSALLLAYIIAGHHAGLADYQSGYVPGDESSTGPRPLLDRLRNPRPETVSALRTAPASLLGRLLPDLPQCVLPKSDSEDRLAFQLLIRMVFSCLIDADRLATERFTHPALSKAREYSRPSVRDLRVALDAHLKSFACDQLPLPNSVSGLRASLLRACRECAAEDRRVFTLTAPTGSGKTLSSLAFALGHAEQHGLDRVIYTLPFTSVTEQNAGVFREVFSSLGEDVVLEHHSAVRTDTREKDGPDQDERERRRSMAAENWDARLIVTTNVQLLESLFASSTSACRKLHRIARSVIILDEAQALPVDLLCPTLGVLQELVTCFGCTVVLCSATMPAVVYRNDFPIGLKDTREIAPDPSGFASAMRRTTIVRIGECKDEQIAEQMTSEPQVLTIVNTRKHAARLYALLRSRATHVYHLSALMCPEHRSARVAHVKRLLSKNRECRLVSTQVVEAGIDIDFPVVYRAFAGLDSIVQAAGRCNREGNRERGVVRVFTTDVKPPMGMQPAMSATRDTLDDPSADPLDPTTIQKFFELLYWTKGGPEPRWDGPIGEDHRRRGGGITKLLAARSGICFNTVSKMYKLIDDWACPVVVPYGVRGELLCQELRESHKVVSSQYREAQRYTVCIPPYSYRELVKVGVIFETECGVAVVCDEKYYDNETGLRIDMLPSIECLMA